MKDLLQFIKKVTHLLNKIHLIHLKMSVLKIIIGDKTILS